MGYNNINNLIKTLINNYTTPHININSSTLEDNLEEVLQTSSVAATKRNFWLNFLEFLNSEDSKIHMPLRQSDLDSTGSLGEFINNFADLTENSTDEIFGYIKELLNNSETLNENDNHLMWNYSVNKLIYNVLDSYKRYNDASFKYDGVIIWDDKTFPIIEITKADAGAAFNYNFDADNITDKLVIPWRNQDYMTFKDIMQSEFCVSLNNDKKTQFTRSKSNSYDEWIRLLMPQNNKRVEVIDLDRNFWVISNVLSRICMYLFDEDSTIFSLFKQIINEIMQLWENILYLWIALAIYCNTASSNIHIEFCPVPADNISHDAQYDNLPTSMPSTELTLKERLSYLIDKYPKRILVVIPFVRSSYIKQNLHRNITFSYILWHFPFDSDFSLATLKTENTSKVTITLNSDSSVSNTIGIKDYLVGYKDEVTRYKVSNCGLPIIENLYLKNIEQYQGVARLNASINITTSGQSLKINSFFIQVFDAIREITDNNQNKYNILTLSTFNQILNSDDIIMEISRDKKPVSSTSYASFSYKQFYKGFYVGECLTDFASSKKVSYDIAKRSIPLKPLAVDKLSEITSFGNQKNYDVSVLKSYAEEYEPPSKYNPSTIYFRLFTGRHTAGLHYGSGESKTYAYYDLDGNQNLDYIENQIFYVDTATHKILSTTAQTGYELANHYTGELGLGASLQNPLSRTGTITYPSYIHQTEAGDVDTNLKKGGIAFPTFTNVYGVNGGTGKSYVWKYCNGEQFFIHRKMGDTEFTQNNWFIRYIQWSGSYVLPYNSDKEGANIWQSGAPISESIFRVQNRSTANNIEENQVLDWITYKDKITFNFHIDEDHKNWEGISPYLRNHTYNITALFNTNDLNKLTFYAFVYKIECHIFGPNGEYYLKTYRRKPYPIIDTGYPTLPTFSGTGDNLEDWKVGDETSVNYDKMRNKLINQYNLIVGDDYGTSNNPDFEVAKRNGIVKTSKNTVSSAITPTDEIYWK